MGIFEILIIAVALAMDAFAVSITCGMSREKVSLRNILKVGLFFGIFQTIMPLLGYFVGNKIPFDFTAFDHWIAFGLLALIGINMIRESVSSNNEEVKKNLFGTKTLIVAAIATSIDALAAGFSVSLLNAGIILLATSSGIITFILSGAGVKLGRTFGHIFEKRAEMLSGIVLILIGSNIVIRHLFF